MQNVTMQRIYRAAVLLLIAGSLALAQQVLTLTSGAQLQGRYAGGKANTIEFIDQQGSRHKIDISQIQSLVFTGPLPPPMAPTGAVSYDPNSPASGFAERGYVDSDVEPKGAGAAPPRFPQALKSRCEPSIKSMYESPIRGNTFSRPLSAT